jgi:hypothetical protein
MNAACNCNRITHFPGVAVVFTSPASGLEATVANGEAGNGSIPGSKKIPKKNRFSGSIFIDVANEI